MIHYTIENSRWMSTHCIIRLMPQWNSARFAIHMSVASHVLIQTKVEPLQMIVMEMSRSQMY